jgi:hypothetical protein
MKRNRGRGQAVQDALLAMEDRVDADGLLSEEDKADIKERARKHVLNLKKEAAIDAEFNRQVQLEKSAWDPKERLVDILIDLPVFLPFIRLDNTVFFHGLVYEVPTKVAITMRDQMARSWEHQNEIQGHWRGGDRARVPQNKIISDRDPNGTQITSTATMRAVTHA